MSRPNFRAMEVLIKASKSRFYRIKYFVQDSTTVSKARCAIEYN